MEKINDDHSDCTSQQSSTIKAQTQLKFNNVRATESDVVQGLSDKDTTLFLTSIGASDADNKAVVWSHIMDNENNDNTGAN